MYDYYKEEKADVMEILKNEINFANFESLEELEANLNDRLWIDDSVTGNGSGSYTFSSYKAEKNLCHNMDLLQEAISDFGMTIEEAIEEGPEFCDVTIRCYLLSSVIADCIEEIRPEVNDK